MHTNNKQESFLKAKTVDTRLSDICKMALPVFKKVENKRFDNDKFRECLTIYFSTGKNILYDPFENLIFPYFKQNGINKAKTHQR